MGYKPIRFIKKEPKHCHCGGLRHKTLACTAHHPDFLRAPPSPPPSSLPHTMPRTRMVARTPQQSVADHLHILARRPKDPFAHAGLAITYEGLGYIDHALHHYRESVKFNPRNAATQVNLACLLCKRGALTEAAAHCAKALEAGGCSGLAHNTLAAIKGKQDDIGGAIHHTEQALVFEPNNPKIHRNLGALMARRSQTKLALKHYNRAIVLDPFDARSRFNVAKCYMSDGKNVVAQKHTKVGWRLSHPGGPYRVYDV